MKIYLTKADYDLLKGDLSEKELRIKDLTLKLGETAKKSSSFVDTNPEYMAIKSQIETIQTVASSIKNLLAKVEVKELEDLPSEVTNYSLVEAENKLTGETIKYYIQIPFIKLKSRNGEIVASAESPVGKALYGRKIDEIIDINLPHNTFQLKINNISKF